MLCCKTNMGHVVLSTNAHSLLRTRPRMSTGAVQETQPADDGGFHVTLSETVDNRVGLRPGEVRNKMRRRELHKQQKSQRKKDKREGRTKRKREREELGDKAPVTKGKSCQHPTTWARARARR